jgi:hypothetical protein
MQKIYVISFAKKAKIMGNGLRFASISHGVKKKF